MVITTGILLLAFCLFFAPRVIFEKLKDNWLSCIACGTLLTGFFSNVVKESTPVNEVVTWLGFFGLALTIGYFLTRIGLLWPTIRDTKTTAYQNTIKERIEQVFQISGVDVDSSQEATSKYKANKLIMELIEEVRPDGVSLFDTIDWITTVCNHPELYEELSYFKFERVAHTEDLTDHEGDYQVEITTNFVITLIDSGHKIVVHDDDSIELITNIDAITHDATRRTINAFNNPWEKVPACDTLRNVLIEQMLCYDLSSELRGFVDLFRFEKTTSDTYKRLLKLLVKKGATEDILKSSNYIPYFRYYVSQDIIDNQYQEFSIDIVDSTGEPKWSLFCVNHKGDGVPALIRDALEEMVFLQLESLPDKTS